MHSEQPNILVIPADRLAANLLIHSPAPLASTSWPCAAIARGEPLERDFTAAGAPRKYCQRSDRIYSLWACESIPGYRFPEE